MTMIRDVWLFGNRIRQRAKDDFFNLEDISNVINSKLLSYELEFDFNRFIQREDIQDFLHKLENKIGKNAYDYDGWVHTCLMVKILTDHDQNFEINVYNLINKLNNYNTKSDIYFAYRYEPGED